MKRNLSIAVAAFFVLACFTARPAGAAPDNVMVVETEGTAMKSAEPNESKELALKRALEEAVSETFSTVKTEEGIQADTSTLEKGIASNPDTYVRNYKVVAEGWITHMDDPRGAGPVDYSTGAGGPGPAGLDVYHVWVKVEVDAGLLRDALARVVSLETRSTTDLTLVLIDVEDYPAYNKLVSSLEGLPMVKSHTKRSFYSGKVVLGLVVLGSPFEFKEKFSREIGPGYVVVITGPRTIAVLSSHQPFASK